MSNEPGTIRRVRPQHAAVEEIAHVASEADLVGEATDLVVHEHVGRHVEFELRGVHAVVLDPVTEPVAFEGLASQLQDRSAVDGDQPGGTRLQREQPEQSAARTHVDHHVVRTDQVAQCPSVRIDLDGVGHVATMFGQLVIRHAADRTESASAVKQEPTATVFAGRTEDSIARQCCAIRTTPVRMLLEGEESWTDQQCCGYPSSVSMRTVHDEVVLLDMASEQYYGLNAVGACVIEAVNSGADVDGAISSRRRRLRRTRGPDPHRCHGAGWRSCLRPVCWSSHRD